MALETINIKDVKAHVSTLVKLLRKKQGISRNELAERLDLSRITIQNLESGKNVTVDTLCKVLQHFDLLEKFDRFLQEESSNNSYDSLY